VAEEWCNSKPVEAFGQRVLRLQVFLTSIEHTPDSFFVCLHTLCRTVSLILQHVFLKLPDVRA